MSQLGPSTGRPHEEAVQKRSLDFVACSKVERGRYERDDDCAARPRVAALAAAVGVNVDTIRHHEWNGLLLAPARTPAGLPGLRRIRGCPTAVHPRAQHLGLKLRDIKGLLAIRDTGVCSGEPAEELCAAD